MLNNNVLKNKKLSQSIYTLNGIVKLALLSALAFVLMLVEVPLPLFPAFLKLDVSDLPALIGGFALGPVAAIIIEFIKNIFHFIFKNDGTGGIGNLANFIVGVSFVVPAALVYMKNKSKKGAVIGMAIGTLCLAILASLANYYFLIPFYINFYFGGDVANIIGVMAKANKNIVSIETYILYGVVPFNIIKAIFTSVITFFIYKSISPLLRK
ncbi:MAG: ECF transporter S component [Clostridiales bacterium]|nr:ECF transporter S component [Clostridiales bacterium]